MQAVFGSFLLITNTGTLSTPHVVMTAAGVVMVVVAWIMMPGDMLYMAALVNSVEYERVQGAIDAALRKRRIQSHSIGGDAAPLHSQLSRRSSVAGSPELKVTRKKSLTKRKSKRSISPFGSDAGSTPQSTPHVHGSVREASMSATLRAVAEDEWMQLVLALCAQHRRAGNDAVDVCDALFSVAEITKAQRKEVRARGRAAAPPWPPRMHAPPAPPRMHRPRHRVCTARTTAFPHVLPRACAHSGCGSG